MMPVQGTYPVYSLKPVDRMHAVGMSYCSPGGIVQRATSGNAAGGSVGRDAPWWRPGSAFDHWPVMRADWHPWWENSPHGRWRIWRRSFLAHAMPSGHGHCCRRKTTSPLVQKSSASSKCTWLRSRSPAPPWR